MSIEKEISKKVKSALEEFISLDNSNMYLTSKKILADKSLIKLIRKLSEHLPSSEKEAIDEIIAIYNNIIYDE